MRLVGVTMVRNEIDVIEAFVRHNLSILDALSIVDHGSFDGTSEILEKLRAEGLPLRITRDSNPAYLQSETMTSLAHEAFGREGADFVFALDADEFLKVESRDVLERTLAEVPRGMHALMHWLTYVPDAFDDDAFGPGHLWWRLKTERLGLGKVIISRALVDHPAHVVMGNHAVLSGPEGDIQQHARPRPDAVALAHCPVRSRRQLESKIIVGYLAKLRSKLTDRRLARHWRQLYEELRAGAIFGERRLREVASNYGLPQENWRPVDEIELVEDPVRLAAEQRYSGEGARDPLYLLLRFTEILVDEERAYLADAPESDALAVQYVRL